MMRLDEPLQSTALHMRVDFGGGNVGVPEHLLHAAQIGTAVDEVAGEGMPQYVR